MNWFERYRRLAARGILGMNRRNAECILDHNPRRLYPVVDDKLRLHSLCATIGVPIGSTTFIPEKGIRLDDSNSWVQYQLAQPLSSVSPARSLSSYPRRKCVRSCANRPVYACSTSPRLASELRAMIQPF